MSLFSHQHGFKLFPPELYFWFVLHSWCPTYYPRWGRGGGHPQIYTPETNRCIDVFLENSTKTKLGLAQFIYLKLHRRIS